MIKLNIRIIKKSGVHKGYNGRSPLKASHRGILRLYGSVAIIFALIGTLYAGQDMKKRIAVLEIKSVNVTKEECEIARSAIELFLVNTQAFDILERDQLNVVARERDKKIMECIDANCASTIGKLVSADYVVIGSIDKIDRYTITVKIVEVGKNRIVASSTEQFNLQEKLRPAAEKAAQEIAFSVTSSMSGSMHRTGKPAPVIAAKFQYLIPVGSFQRIMGNGYGACLHVGMENIIFRGLQGGIEGHFFYFGGKKDKTKNSFMVPIIVQAGYAFAVNRFSIIPSIGGGISYNENSYYRNSSIMGITRLKSWQAMTRVELELLCYLTPIVALQAGGSFWQVYEKNAVTMFASVSAGVRARF